MNFLRKRERISTRFADRRGRRTRRPRLEILEPRELLATVSVNAGQVIRSVNTQLLGVNLVNWDTNLNTSQTQQMVQAAGLNFFRFPGGSSSDDFHFNAAPSYTGQGTDGTMASFVASVNGQALITLDYGSGSPQEAAAELAYFNGSVNNTTVIGNGLEWSDSANAWQTVNFQTVGYWASLRAAAPLANDPDNMNFLRLNHPAAFGFQYWEVGNEEYGSWEIDHHTAQHDPTTYIGFAKQFATYAAAISPGISIGLDVGSPGSDDNNWFAAILQQSVAQQFTPGFLSDHNYVQAPGSENDSTLLLDTTTGTNSDPSDPGNPFNYAQRAADYESALTKYLRAAGSKVLLLATEFNSVYSNPGKQTTSLVNGLWVADTLGALLETNYAGADVWDLRNYYDNSNNNSSSLYGWRQAGDYGILGSPNGSAPASGAYVPYPTYFAEQLASKIIETGGNVVQASSSDPNLTTYAVLEASGQLELLVINKSAAGAISGQFSFAGFTPASQATVWQYGEAQDTAQSQSSTGASALANFSTSLTVNGSTFSYSFPAYSMSVMVLSPVSAGPTFTKPATATPSPVTATTTVLSALATDPAGAASVTYTWASMGTPPAAVSFSANGTNAAQSTTATFAKAGSYTFQVTAKDAGGLTAVSTVTVVVNQTATSVVVSPATVTVPAGGTQSFTARVNDQFGTALATQPALNWSVTSGVGTIGSSTGIYVAPASAGTAVVQATGGGVSGTAGVTVSSPASPATASFLGSDSTTEGSWIGKYGAQGYDIVGSTSKLPGYVTVTPAGQSSWTWAPSTTLLPALQTPGGTSRIAATWDANPTFTVDVNFTDGQTHDLELYLLDWDKLNRSETITLSNAATGAVLATAKAPSFQTGLYLDWAVSGNILITIQKQTGANAVLSGLFFDTPPASVSAALLEQDTTTEGSWIGTYGTQGYDIVGATASIPSYVTVTPAGQSSWTWSASTPLLPALQTPGGTTRIAATWDANPTFTVDVNFTDGKTHDLELYLLDWDKLNRSETVTLSNAATGAVLATTKAASFTTGVYLDWAVSGNILITIQKLTGANAVLSGLFFDPGPVSSSSLVKTSSVGGAIATSTTGGPAVVGTTDSAATASPVVRITRATHLPSSAAGLAAAPVLNLGRTTRTFAIPDTRTRRPGWFAGPMTG